MEADWRVRNTERHAEGKNETLSYFLRETEGYKVQVKTREPMYTAKQEVNCC